MTLFARRARYDRVRILEAAERERVRNRFHRAVALYRRVLAFEPQNARLHARLAPLLAATGQSFDAWMSFRAAAGAALRENALDRALALYREASLCLPREYRAWEAIARAELRRGARREAIEALLEGARRMHGPDLRPHAIHLLRRAREIEPWHFETALELARLLVRTRQIDEAQLLFDGLAARAAGEELRRVCAARLKAQPGPMALWRWLRAVLRPEGDATAALPAAGRRIADG